MIEFVIEAMVDAVLVVDADGLISLSNSGVSRLTGYTRDELRGIPAATLLPDDNSGLRTVVRKRIEDGRVLRREESWLLGKTGERIPVSITGSPVVDSSGALQGIVLVAHDIRQLRQLLADREDEIQRRRSAEEQLRSAKASIEAQLAETRDMLLLAERRATLGTLAGGVGHELNNIAQIQVAAVEALAAAIVDGDAAEVASQILPELERVGEHITAHGHRLMQLARPGPDHVAPIDLHDVVRDVEAMLRLAGKLGHVEVVLALGADPVTVTVNRTRIEQILVNLVTNAVDAIGNVPGRITIEVRPSDRRAICAVSDTGGGIPAETLGKIFEPFFTTKPPDKGTGLGLPVVRDIVESYGGALRVESRVGTGTTMTFDLPR